MDKRLLALGGASLLGVGLILVGCTESSTFTGEGSGATQSSADSVSEVEGEGTLQVRANGEDFVRQGFVSKDGWQIQFEHVFVNLTDVTAFQTDPPYDPDGAAELQPKASVTLVEAKTVDLAEGDEAAEPILVGEVKAPAGRYNALAWNLTPAADGPAAGYGMVLVGAAQKEGQTVNFRLNIDRAYAFTCGEFVGDERKGILQPGAQADLEATFHFDHIFGDGDAPAEDDINTGALGFDPLAALAQGEQLEVDLATLKEQLSESDYQTLEATLLGLAHVGEGHCREMTSSS